MQSIQETIIMINILDKYNPKKLKTNHACRNENKYDSEEINNLSKKHGLVKTQYNRYNQYIFEKMVEC